MSVTITPLQSVVAVDAVAGTVAVPAGSGSGVAVTDPTRSPVVTSVYGAGPMLTPVVSDTTLTLFAVGYPGPPGPPGPPGGGGGATNLGYIAATRTVTSDTGTDATLPVVSSTEAGLAPASGGGTTNFLRADGTWAAPPGGGGGGGSSYFPSGW